MYHPRKTTPPDNAATDGLNEAPRPAEEGARSGRVSRRFRPEAKDLYGYAHGYLRHKYDQPEEEPPGKE